MLFTVIQSLPKWIMLLAVANKVCTEAARGKNHRNISGQQTNVWQKREKGAQRSVWNRANNNNQDKTKNPCDFYPSHLQGWQHRVGREKEAPWTVWLLGTALAPPSNIWPLAVPWQQAQMQMFLGWDHLNHSSWPGLVSYRSSLEKELSLPAQMIPSLTLILHTFWALQKLQSPDPLVRSLPLPAFIELRGREDSADEPQWHW